MSLEKRRREAEKRRKREAKAADRARRRADKIPKSEMGGEDPDLAGIVPGPQPHPFYDDEEVAQISDD